MVRWQSPIATYFKMYESLEDWAMPRRTCTKSARKHCGAAVRQIRPRDTHFSCDAQTYMKAADEAEEVKEVEEEESIERKAMGM